jgi:peptidoglycan/xylan/chitin deacetylase (PgdA/CDA1 family)
VTEVNVCFHGVGTPRRALEPDEDTYWVPTDTFLSMLDEIAGWPSVHLSFDDGNASDVEIALPALVERGLRAEFFVLAGRLDQPGSLDPDDIRQLHEAGMSIGNHGLRHRPWRGMDHTALTAELVEARQVLAEIVGRPVDRAACPLGRYDRTVLTYLRRLGYERVYTSDRRPARTGAWLQPRYSVRSHHTSWSLREEALAGPGLAGRLHREAVSLVKRLR